MRFVYIALILVLLVALYAFWRNHTHSPSPGRFNAPPIHMPKQGILM